MNDWYELTFRIRMTVEAQELVDKIIALPEAERDAALLALRAFDRGIATLTRIDISKRLREND